MAPVKTAAAPAASTPAAATPAPSTPKTAVRPIAPGGIEEQFAPAAALRPALLGVIKVHYAQAKADVDVWQELKVVAPVDADTAGDFWEQASVADPQLVAGLGAEPAPNAAFASLPRTLDAKAVGKLQRTLADWVYRAAPLRLFSAKALDLTSTPGQSEAEFRAQVAIKTREARDAAIDKLRKKYQPKLDALADKHRTAEQRVAREQAQASAATTDSMITVGASVLGALFGGRRASATKVASAARSVSRTAGQRGDVTRAQESLDQVAARRSELDAQLEADIAALREQPDPEVEAIELKAKKADTVVTRVALLWLGA